MKHDVKKTAGPITWFGGKGKMVNKLLPFVPPHHTYCEVFGGGAALLFSKPPAPVEVYNDIDKGLVGFFRVLQNPEQFPELSRRLSVTLYSRNEYNLCRDTWREQDDPIERARRWYIVARQSFGGRFNSGWGFVRTASSRNMAESTSTWLSTLDSLPAFHERVMRVQIECDDWRTILHNYDTPDTFFYLDPPYVVSKRSGGKYTHELTDDDHADLIAVVQKLDGMVLLSGYDNGLYQPLTETGWHTKSWETVSYAAGRTRGTGILGAGAALKMQPRTETIWWNQALDDALGRGRQLSLPFDNEDTPDV